MAAKTRTSRKSAEAPQFTHLDSQGQVRMVDVGGKPITRREAIARCSIRMEPATLTAMSAGALKKGDVFATARLAGIMAAKRTFELIPLCHQIPLESVEVDFHRDPDGMHLHVETHAVTQARTGVEMEAMAAASVAALTIYDMAKAVDRGMIITDIRLVMKSGGRSGTYRRSAQPA
jgi:cyclic pyranopterin monophosphate synthase